MILAIETSCDDTCAAVVTGDGRIRSNVVSSQHVHDRFGGVVPEIASRHHLELVNAVVDDALATAGASLDDVELLALTQGPGLVGALLVGVVDTFGRTVLQALFREFLPPQMASAAGPAVASVAIYVFMAVVLAVRPQGLFPARG